MQADKKRKRRVLIYTVKETAELLSMSPHTIRRWAKAGSLEGFSFGGLTHISAASIRALLKAHSLKPRLPAASIDPAAAWGQEIEHEKVSPGSTKEE